MEDTSIFGDSSLFDEFEREPEPSDKILKQKLMKDERLKHFKSIDDGSDSAFSAEFHIGSSPESCDTESENDFIENEDSDHGGGITGVGELVTSLQEKPARQIGKELNGDNGAERYLEIRKQLEELSQENQQLKKQIRLVTCDRVLNHEEEGPAIQVIFMNHPISRKFKTEIEEFINHLVQNDDKNDKIRDLNLRSTSVCLSKNATKIAAPKEKIRQIEKTTSIGCSQFYRDFIVDAMGWPMVEYNPSLTDGWQTPWYEQFYNESLPLEEEDEGAIPKKPQRMKATCFNCGGDHNLRDCKERKDFKKINKARKEFMDSSSPANHSLKKKRYILNENDAKEERFKPGEISNNLKEALGINSQQLPPYIYQMRRLGYPPGWLLEAEVFLSGVAIFDKYGKEVSKDGKAAEEGEIDVNKEKKKYNIDKVISYPGFNVDPPKGTIDEYRKLNMLPMQPSQQKGNMGLNLAPTQLTGSGKKRKPNRDDYQGDIKKSKCDDMDLAQSDDDDPSLSSLESHKQLLKVQLAAMETLNSCDDAQEEGEIMDDNFIPPVPPTPEAPPLPPGTPPVTPKTPSTELAKRTNGDGIFKTPLSTTPSSGIVPLANSITPTRIPLPKDTPPAQRVSNDIDNDTDTQEILSTPDCKNGLLLRSSISSSGSVSSTFGTPVIEGAPSSNSVLGKGLPEASKFAAGITEHLPFENLPQATGKYNQMRKVLDWVRSKN